MTSKDSDSQPDIDVQVGEKRLRISVTPFEWVIIGIIAIVITILVR